MTNEKNMNTTTAEVTVEAKAEVKAEKKTAKTAPKKTAEKKTAKAENASGNNPKAVLRTLTTVSANSDGMDTENLTVEIPTFVKAPDIFFGNVQALYFQSKQLEFENQITSINETLKNEPGDTMNRRTLELKKGYLEDAVKKLKELYSKIADTYKHPEADRVANLFFIALGYKKPKEVDTAMGIIYKDISKHYNMFRNTDENESEESKKLRNDSFKSIREKLLKYHIGQFETEDCEEYNAHSLRKLTAGFVNDIIAFTYDKTKLDGKSSKNRIASGAFRTSKKQATTVYVEIITKYFQLFQLNGRNIEGNKDSVK